MLLPRSPSKGPRWGRLPPVVCCGSRGAGGGPASFLGGRSRAAVGSAPGALKGPRGPRGTDRHFSPFRSIFSVPSLRTRGRGAEVGPWALCCRPPHGGLCSAGTRPPAWPGPAHPAGPEGAVDVFVDGSRGRRLRRSAAWQGWQEASPLLEGDPVPETAGSSLDAGAPWGGACRLRCFFSSGGTGPHRRARGQRSRGAWGGDSPGHWGHPPPAPSLCSGLGPVEGRGRKVTALAFMAASCVLTTPRPLQRRTGPELWRAFQGMRNTLKGLNRKSPR